MPQPANQRESFPKFDIVAANHMMNRIPAAVCVFEIGPRMIGQLFLSDVLEESVVINYLFSAPHVHCLESVAVIATRTSSTPLDRGRRLAGCPLCKQFRWSLYYKGVWACADCLGLHYRRQLVAPEVVRWERYDELGKQLKYGRPKGMHNETYRELRQELIGLEMQLRDRPRKYASDTHDLIVTSRWVAGAEIEFWSSQYRVWNGDFVRWTDE